MRITLLAIGKGKAGPERDLFDQYAARLPWKITLKEHDIKKPLSVEDRKAKEAEWLLAQSADADLMIALDERGKDLSSTAFAKYLTEQRDSGARSLACIIGGTDGLDESVRKKADLLLSLGKMTWPHLLVRGLIAEQLYRAYTIIHRHPYHRE